MKENIKAQFFSQYLYTDTIVLPCFMSRDQSKMCRTTLLTPELLNAHKDGPSYLLLRSVEQLTDEEYITIAKLHQSPLESCLLEIGKDTANVIAGSPPDRMMGVAPIYMRKMIAYLEGIGIILPFTYLDENNKPITIQPDEIISMGWAKLKTL